MINGGWSIRCTRKGWVNLFGLKKGRLKGHLTAILNCLIGEYGENGARLPLVVLSDRKGGNGHKLQCGKRFLFLSSHSVYYFYPSGKM